MAAMPSAIFREGTSEILNWIVIAGAADRPGKVVDYSPALPHQNRRRLRHGICPLGFALRQLHNYFTVTVAEYFFLPLDGGSTGLTTLSIVEVGRMKVGVPSKFSGVHGPPS